MNKKIIAAGAAVLLAGSLSVSAAHTVVRGDTMWKIASKYQVGTRELIGANRFITNPDLIYPGQVLEIPAENGAVSSYEAQIVRMVNAERAKVGAAPLKINWQLSRVARYKSQDMHDKNYFSHTSPTYGSPYDMMKSFGITYRRAGENIASNYRTAEATMNGWMKSAGHRANILDTRFTEIGVGYVADGNYCTQMFIG